MFKNKIYTVKCFMQVIASFLLAFMIGSKGYSFFENQQSIPLCVFITWVVSIALMFVFNLIYNLIGGLIALWVQKLVGYKILSFNLFGFQLVNVNGHLIVNKRKFCQFCYVDKALPPKMKNGKYPLDVMFFARYIPQIIIAGTSIALFFVLGDSLNFYVSLLFYIIAVAFILNVTNLIPLKTVGDSTDAYKLILHRKEDLRKFYWFDSYYRYYFENKYEVEDMEFPGFIFPTDEEYLKYNYFPIFCFEINKSIHNRNLEDVHNRIDFYLNNKGNIRKAEKYILLTENFLYYVYKKDFANASIIFESNEYVTWLNSIKNSIDYGRTMYLYTRYILNEAEKAESYLAEIDKLKAKNELDYKFTKSLIEYVDQELNS